MEAGTSFDREARKPLVEAALKALGMAGAKLDGARVLVTGARGFFGRYVVETLLQLNREDAGLRAPISIVAADSYAVGNEEPRVEEWRNEPHLTTYKCDLTHAGGLLFGGRKFTHIWHLAGIASPYWYKKLPEETIAVSVDGTRTLLRYAREHGARFMFTSSSEVYQTADVVPTPETYVGAIPSCSERSCYDVSKLMAETLCYVEGQKHDTHVSVVRIFNSFGPGMAEVDRRILPRIASAMKGKKKMKVFAPGLRTWTEQGKSLDELPWLPKRTYTPVANTLLGFLKVAIDGGRMGVQNAPEGTGIYNVGLDVDEISVPQLIAKCVAAAGHEVEYSFIDPPDHYQTEPKRRCPDVTKLRELGWSPCMGLDEGLRSFFGWAMQTYVGID
ncbi:MAG: NAD-dependent epimerase/dehydratase family protein [Salinibacterium sp.]|nr:MAG: NAD-dependent epimerase/dehydratase family protein [Salinibacterium sp.]